LQSHAGVNSRRIQISDVGIRDPKPALDTVLAPLSYKIFVINLDRSVDRLNHMKAQSEALQFEYERVQAVDGRENLPPWLMWQFSENSGMSNGEIGCYASHLCACVRFRQHSFDFAIILEDDAVLDADFEAATIAAVRSAPAEWDIIHLSSHPKNPVYPLANIGEQRALIRYSRLPTNSAAYAISTAGAVKLLAGGQRLRPYDLEFRYAWRRGLEVYGVFPAPARQHLSFVSTIEADWRRRPNEVRRRPGKTNIQLNWQPSPLSKIRGWLFVKRRLGLVGTICCWKRRVDFLVRSRLRVKSPRASPREAL
jgi:glycosyl transferase family 25